MTITDIAAWYAASVASAVFAWDIIKWLRNAPRLRVNTMSNVTFIDGRTVSRMQLTGDAEVTKLAEYCHIEVLNIGSQPTTLLNIEATHKPKGNGIQVGCVGSAFATLNGSHPLPALIGPGEVWSARLEMSHLECIAKHGRPLVRIRASHRNGPIEKYPAMPI